MVAVLLASALAAPSSLASPRGDYASTLRRKVLIDGNSDQEFSVHERMNHYGVPGVSVAVVEGCKIVDVRGFGTAAPGGRPVDSGTLFQAGSVSKAVAAAGALKLVEAGALSLDEDVSRFLRNWDIPRPATLGAPVITLRHLLSHGGGLTVDGFKGYPTDSALPDLTQILDGEPPANTAPVRIEQMPGTSWRYSGGGFVLAQLLMEQTTGTLFHEFMRDRILRPAGMYMSSYQQPLDPTRAPRAAHGTLADGTPIPGGWRIYPEQAAAGLWSTPSDLSRFAIALVRSMRSEDAGLLEQGTAQEMMRRQIGAWGLGIEVSPEGQPRKFGHTGAPVGYRTLWLMFPDTCQGATVMTNSDEGMTLAYEVARAIADQYAWPDRMPSERVAHIPLSAEIASRFIGTYRLRDFPGERFEIRMQPDGSLSLSRLGHGVRDLVASSSDELISPDSGMRLVALDRNPRTGKSTRLELHFTGGVNVAHRIDSVSESSGTTLPH